MRSFRVVAAVCLAAFGSCSCSPRGQGARSGPPEVAILPEPPGSFVDAPGGPASPASLASAAGVANRSQAPKRPALSEERKTLVAEGGNGVEVYPPLHAGENDAPLVVFLHATCMQPVDVCDFWSPGGRDTSFLVCPAGPSRCAGEPDWAGTPKVKAAALDAALTAVDARFGPWIDRRRGDVLIGYSRGAFAARDILYEGTTRFRGLVLLSASLSPEPAKLKAAGIRRALLATGELDGSRGPMLHAVDKLNAAGIPTRFVSLGRIGHWLPRNLEDILRDAIAWVAPAGEAMQ